MRWVDFSRGSFRKRPFRSAAGRSSERRELHVALARGRAPLSRADHSARPFARRFGHGQCDPRRALWRGQRPALAGFPQRLRGRPAKWRVRQGRGPALAADNSDRSDAAGQGAARAGTPQSDNQAAAATWRRSVPMGGLQGRRPGGGADVLLEFASTGVREQRCTPGTARCREPGAGSGINRCSSSWHPATIDRADDAALRSGADSIDLDAIDRVRAR